MIDKLMDVGEVHSGRPVKADHDAIIQAAWDLFESVGFDQATMTEVAAKAGISRRTLFNHFDCKEALLFHSINEFVVEFRTQLAKQNPNLSLFEQIKNGLLEALQVLPEPNLRFRAGPEVSRARSSEASFRYTRELWAKHFESVISEHLAADPNRQIKANLVSAIAAQAWTQFNTLIAKPAPASEHRKKLEQVLAAVESVFVGD